MTVFIGCVKEKKSYPSRAEELYDSTFFKKCLAYAKSMHPDNIYILSALYGVVNLDDVISPYDKTLNTMNKSERLEWSQMVYKQLSDIAVDFNSPTVWLCGSKYRNDLIQYFPHSQYPLEGMGIGCQLSFMTQQLTNNTPKDIQIVREEDLWG